MIQHAQNEFKKNDEAVGFMCTLFYLTYECCVITTLQHPQMTGGSVKDFELSYEAYFIWAISWLLSLFYSAYYGINTNCYDSCNVR